MKEPTNLVITINGDKVDATNIAYQDGTLSITFQEPITTSQEDELEIWSNQYFKVKEIGWGGKWETGETVHLKISAPIKM